MYRPKKKRMQIGGTPTFTSQAQLDAANKEAQRFTSARGLFPALAGTKLGDPIPQYKTPDGKPYVPGATIPTSTYIPDYVGIDDIQAGQDGIYSYADKQSGDLVPVNSSVLNLPRFRKPINPNMVASRDRGGKFQMGGDFTSFSTPNEPLPQEEDRLALGLRSGIIQQNRAVDPYQYVPQPQKKRDPMEAYLAMQAGEIPLQFLGRSMENGRQNQYLQDQYSTLGQENPIPADNSQPNPYSLYAKYGGSMRKYQKGGVLGQAYYDRANQVDKAKPSYNFAAGMRPKDTDSILYDIQFNHMLNNQPNALRSRARYEQYGIPTYNGKEGIDMNVYNIDRSRQNAYEDAMSQQGSAGLQMIQAPKSRHYKFGGRK